MGTVKDIIANCKSKYVIYAITCKTCNIQYVGETQAMLRDRMHQHRSSMRNEERNTYLCNHFNEPEHDSENFYIDILDNIENDDKRTRLNKELFWIKLLMTPYPFGLNDQVIGYGNISSEILPFDKSSHPYYGFKIIRFKQKRSKRKKRHNVIHDGNQIDTSAIIDSISKQRTHQLHCTLKNLSNRKINNLFLFLRNKQLVEELDNETHLKIVGFLAKFYWFNNDKMRQKNVHTAHNFNLTYWGSYMESANIPKVIYETIKSYIPNYQRNILNIRVTFKYTDPISTRILNYSKFLRNLSSQEINNILNTPCVCESIKDWVDPHHGHICTGDATLFSHLSIHKILKKGANFRLKHMNPNVEALSQEIAKSCTKLTNELCKKIDISEPVLEEMKTILRNNMTNAIKRRLNNKNAAFNQLKDNYHNNLAHDQFDQILTKDLSEIHKDFIVTLTDKATSNYSFTCKKLYIMFMNEETGYFANTTTLDNPYQKYTLMNEETLLNKHCQLSSKWNGELDEQLSMTIPRIYGAPKLHKSPIKLRFITGAKTSSIRNLSINVQRLLKHIKLHFQRYCRVIEGRTNIKSFWSIDGSLQLIKELRRCKVINPNVYSADFSSLFTNLPHTIVKKSVFSIIDLCFKNAGKHIDYISIEGQHTFYSKEQSNKPNVNSYGQ